MTQTAEQKAELKAAQEAAPDEETLRNIAARVPPLKRDEEHSFVPVEETDRPEGKDVQGEPEDSRPGSITVTRPDRANSTYERSAAFSEAEIERLSDEQLAELKGKIKSRVPLTHLAPSSERPRQPGAKAPAAGAGSWPVHEGQMPAVMPTDGPVESAKERELAGDNTFAKAAGLNRNKDGSLSRKGLRVEKNEVAQAAALYLRLRQQFPAFTEEQLSDEFELQWLSGRAGAPQSHRAGEELSQHGLTEVGDDRVETINLGEQRAKSDAAFEADAQTPDLPAAQTPEAGLPSQNEPASTAVDAAKESSGETAEADKAAVKEAAKLEKKAK